MTAVSARIAAPALRRAAIAATRAPSIHNSQPWRLALAGGTLELHSDASRRMQALDPYGRQLMLSCGCALLNARVALAAAGVGAAVQHFPEPQRPGLLARVAGDPSGAPDRDLAALAPALEQRRTNRREFADEPVPDRLVAELVAAAGPGAELRPVPADAVPDVARLARDAAPHRAAEPGYPDAAATNQTLLLLGCAEDNPVAWLSCGETLERVLLTAAHRGLATSLFAEVVEVPRTNALLRERLGLRMHPQLLLRVGRAPHTPPTRRRRLVDVLTETD